MLLALPAEPDQREQQMQEIINCENAPSPFKQAHSSCDAAIINIYYKCVSGMVSLQIMLWFNAEFALCQASYY